MAQIIPQLDRLKSQLLTSGLQDRNQALFQVINQLIDAVRQGVNTLNDNITTISSSSGGGGTTTIIGGGNIMPRDGEDGEDGLTIPGPQGKQGPIGPQGVPGLDGTDCECWDMPFIGNVLLSTTGTYTQVIP